MWFEAFPLVYIEIYHFNQGVSGLPFLGIVVGSAVGGAFYVGYLYYYLNPKYVREGGMVPEERLKLAVGAGCLIPISLFIFGASLV